MMQKQGTADDVAVIGKRIGQCVVDGKTNKHVPAGSLCLSDNRLRFRCFVGNTIGEKDDDPFMFSGGADRYRSGNKF